MLFIDFADAPAGAESTTAVHDSLAPRAATYYSEVSYGRVSLEITPQHQWYRMPRPASAYDMTTSLGRARWITDALQAADADVDFGRYQLFYIASSPGSYEGIDPIFNPPGRGFVVDGTELRHGVLVGVSRRLRELPAAVTWAGPAHEIGHVLGLPDLYLVETRDEAQRHLAVGPWDLMAFTSRNTTATVHFLAWHKRKLGWLEPAQVVCANTTTVEQTLTPLERAGGVKAIVVPTGPHTAYVAEARQKIGTDAGICETGVLLYTVDTSVPSGSEPVTIKPARSANGRCGPLSFAPFKAGGCFEHAPTNFRLEVKGEFTVRVSPAGEGCRARDTTAPRLSLAVARTTVARALARGLKVTVGCNEPCSVQVAVSVSGTIAGRGRAQLTTADRAGVVVKLSARGVALLRRARAATVAVTAIDTARNRSSTRTTVRFRS